MAKRRDKYANIINAEVNAAGIVTATQEITTGVSLGEGKGMLIDQIDYFFASAMVISFIAAAGGDHYKNSWSVQSDEFGYSNSRVIHQQDIVKWLEGTPANSHLTIWPKVYQFFPPMILASPKIFFNGTGSASIATGQIFSRMYFRYVDLSPQEYLELAESFVLMS